MTRPLISDATGAAPSPLQPQEYLENVGVELEEVSEQPFEEVSGEVLG